MNSVGEEAKYELWFGSTERLAMIFQLPAIRSDRSECLLPTQPVDGPTHAAPDIKDCYGLGAAIRRVSHEQQLWAGHVSSVAVRPRLCKAH